MRGAQIGLDSGAPGLARLPSASQKRGAEREARPGPMSARAARARSAAGCQPRRIPLCALRAARGGRAGVSFGRWGGAVRCVPSCRRSWVRVRVYLGALVPTEPVLASREGFWSSSSCTKYANVLIDRRSWRLLLL